MMVVKPMLAVGVEPENVVFPCIASPKVDGIRILNWEGNPFTRSMKPIPNNFVRTYLSSKVFQGLDGECVVGEPNDPAVFKNTTGKLRSHSGEPDFTWWVFDERWEVTDLRGFQSRYGLLKEAFANGVFSAFPRVKLLPHKLINTPAELKAFEEECALDGWEGVMLRSVNGPYKNGRSTLKEGYLLKRKLWDFSEAKIVGIYEKMTNENEAFTSEVGSTKRSTNAENLVPAGTLGGFNCIEISTGQAFNLGAGGTHEERQKLWDEREENDDYKGRFARFKHMPYGRVDAPRQPIFDSFREKFDMDEGSF